MAKTYKAPSGLGSAVRGRSSVQRDYTSGVKFKAQERRADTAALRSTLGLVQQITAGTAALSSALGDNLESHKDLEIGARRVFESSGQEGTFEDSGFQGEEGVFKKLFTQAGEGSKTQMIGGAEFSTADLTNIGKVDSVLSEKQGNTIKDDLGNITGYESLFDTFKSSKSVATSTMSETGTDIIKNKKQENQRNNAITNKPSEPIVEDNEIIGGSENLPEQLKNQYDATMGGTSPMEGEKRADYRNRIRDMGLNPSEKNEQGDLVYSWLDQ